ncbi:unnamed protein product [Urochloa humidicola]
MATADAAKQQPLPPPTKKRWDLRWRGGEQRRWRCQRRSKLATPGVCPCARARRPSFRPAGGAPQPTGRPKMASR